MKELILNQKRDIRVVGDFENSEEVMEAYIKNEAFNNAKRGLERIHLIFEGKELIAYYGLKYSQYSISSETNSKWFDSIPCVQIETFAVTEQYRRKGYGTYIFFKFILPKCIRANKEIACKYIMLYSLNDTSTKFYKKLGFKEIIKDGSKQKLFTPLDTFNLSLDVLTMKIWSQSRYNKFAKKNNL